MSQRWRSFVQLILARVREFYREPEPLFWVYGFPLLLAIGLGIAFSSNGPQPPTVDVQASDPPTQAQELADRLRAVDLKVEVLPAAECKARLRQAQSSLYLIPSPADGPHPHPSLECVFDPVREDSVQARYWVEAVLNRRGSSEAISETKVSEPGSRYIDFLLPGLIGTNIMGGGLFGVGFVLVDMRVRKLFKRLMATPMRHGDFLLAILGARMLFLIPEMCSLLLAGWLIFGVAVQGSFLTLALVILFGALAFAGIGLLLGSRTEKTETATGLMNVVMLPMYILSGVFFASSRFPAAVQPIIQALPLTQLIDALRAVMLEGAGLDRIAWRLAILAAWGGCSFLLALRLFRWR